MITMSLREGFSLLVFGLVFLAVYGLEALLWIDYLWGRICRRTGPSELLARRYRAVHAVAAIGIVCMLYGYFVEPYWIDVSTTTLPTSKLQTARFRVVQVSDLHCDTTARNEDRMVQIINGLQPDLVVATGDYLNHPAALGRLRDSLRRLEASLGKFAVRGNQDARHRGPFDLLDGTGFRWLHRETVVVVKGTDQLGITGMDFVPANRPIDLIASLAGERFDVFLFHTPDLIADVAGRGVDLYLCGHTHGGQVCLPGYGALITFSKFGKKYESGMHRVGQTTLCVNRGLGLEPRPGPQVRFLARPQIAVFDIVPERP
ncbi:MAG: metallophosphoesterase [Planctomycetes bacterium]|jgi:hypothetical protein|nr:metallophosphoesterase [Planctomycetota bacterium]